MQCADVLCVTLWNSQHYFPNVFIDCVFFITFTRKTHYNNWNSKKVDNKNLKVHMISSTSVYFSMGQLDHISSRAISLLRFFSFCGQ